MMTEDKDIFRNEENYMSRNPVRRFFQRLLNREVLGYLESLIAKARGFGLPEQDIKNALIDIEYNELELAFDTITQQIYEHEINIDKEFYNLALKTCKIMNLDVGKYIFLEELIDKYFKNTQ